jgi:hypothetical protein
VAVAVVVVGQVAAVVVGRNSDSNSRGTPAVKILKRG